MKKSFLRRITSMALCAALTLSLSGAAFAFHDVTADSALSKSLSVLQEKGLVKGTGKDAFRPDASITVAELCTFLGRIAGDSVDQQNVPQGVNADGWSGGYVAWAKQLGLVDAAAGQYDRLTQAGVNFILQNFCALLGVETVSVDSAIQGGVTRGEAATALAALAQADFNRVKDVAYTTITTGEDWGPAIPKVVLNLGTKVDAASVKAEGFSAASARTFSDLDWMTYELSEPYPHAEERAVTAAYVSDAQGNKAATGTHITLELQIGPDNVEGSPYNYNMVTGMNEPIPVSHSVATTVPIKTADGKTISLAPGFAAPEQDVKLLADDFDTAGKYTYTYDGGKREIDLTYAAWLPKENAKASSTPLIIWLQGAGEGGTDPNVAILGNKVVNLITDDVQQYFGTTGAAVLAPQTPTMWLDTSGSWMPSQSLVGNVSGESFYTEALMSLITDYVNSHPEIDKTRLYIGGCSNGGFMTINLLVTYPGVFAAGYPVCEPYSNDWMTEEKLQNLIDTPLWLTAAKNDMVTIYEGEFDENYIYHVTYDENGEATPIYDFSNALVDRLTKAGATNVHYSLFEDVQDTSGLYKGADGKPYQYNGHWSWIHTLNNECVEKIDGKDVTIFQWLADQKGGGKLPTLPLEKKVYEPINFYLVRHGQTEYNVAGVMQGWTDSPLTEKGTTLAKQLGSGLKDIPFTAAYSSTSGRAVDTAKNVLAGRDVTLTQNENLREMYFGTVDGKSNEGVYTEENIGYRFGVGFDDLGGETWEGLGARMVSALETAALEQRDKGGNVLISTHGMSILSTLYTVVPDAPGVMDQGEIENCSVTILEWDNGVYTLKTLNDTSYLK